MYDEHNKRIEKLIGIDYSKETLTRHKTSRNHITRFINEQYGKEDIPINKIDHKFLVKYELYLKTARKCNHNSAMNYILNVGKIIRSAFDDGWIKVDPFSKFKVTKKKVNRPFLAEEELVRLINIKLPIKRLDQIRDIFVFCCFTGLAFVDIKNLKMHNIITGIDGKMSIKNNRHKTSVDFIVPILPIAYSLIKKYENSVIRQKENMVLPVPSNQKMNAYLKEIADLAGIKKELTTHIARHTFATTVALGNGVPMETISKMMGHSDIKMTQHYARTTEKLVAAQSSILYNKYPKGFELNPG